MSKQQIMVDEFHEKMGAVAPRGEYGRPVDVVYRADFVRQEVDELAEAMNDNNLIDTIDALCDLLYVVYGTAVSLGVNLDPFFAEVHRSNMTKTPNGNGKAIKGPNYSPPNLTRILREGGSTIPDSAKEGA